MEMELELITDEEARQKPVGRARDEPNQHPTLEPPKCVKSILNMTCVVCYRHHFVFYFSLCSKAAICGYFLSLTYSSLSCWFIIFIGGISDNMAEIIQ